MKLLTLLTTAIIIPIAIPGMFFASYAFNQEGLIFYLILALGVVHWLNNKWEQHLPGRKHGTKAN